MSRRQKDPHDWSPRPANAKAGAYGSPIWPAFMDAYFEAALWSTLDEQGHPLDDNFEIEDFSAEAVKKAVEEANDFITANRRALDAVGDEQQHGHDFWLSRNGHGAGFFDRGYGDIGDTLQRKASEYGSVDIYKGDDGKLHFA